MDKQRHSELKKEYKNRPKNMGVYQIKNNVNGKIFLGNSLNLDATFNKFIMGSKYGWGWNGNREMFHEMNEYGPENFSFEILDKLKPNEDPLYNYSDDLKVLEELWLEKLEPYGDKGYNPRKKE